MKRNIIFFDGVCNLCNWSVNLIIKLDKKKYFYFASFQGETAKELQFSDFSSVIYVNESGDMFDKSDAVIEIGSRLFRFGKLIIALKIVPKFFRDWVYGIISKNRYRLFGKKDSCRLPTPEERGHFLN